MNLNQCHQLIEKGVRIPNPETVFISEEVDLDRISGNDVVIYPGCRIRGGRTLIMAGSQIGYEAPVTLDNTLVGPKSRLMGGFFQGAVFAGRNVFGSGAHVRAGTILEEEANAAHTVGLKQTLLFPFVTLGSLINFCDCFMAGGRSRKDHSEVGSSYIHFNYTPNQDKATPSMMGNVHQGVMLNQNPIFLGGQGGLVGPLRIGFGCITAAGAVVRKDEIETNRLILAGGLKSISLPRQPGVYTQVTRVFNHNIQYIAGLMALNAWYETVRPLFAPDRLHRLLTRGMQENLRVLIDERIKRLGVFSEKLSISKEILSSRSKKSNNLAGKIREHDRVIEMFGRAETLFEKQLATHTISKNRDAFIQGVEQSISTNGRDYIAAIQGLNETDQRIGTQWLYEIETGLSEPLMI